MQLTLDREDRARENTSGFWYSTRTGARVILESTTVRAVLLSCLAGLILAVLILVLGLKALPIVFALVFVLPWLMKDSFRLFLWLIVTWPLLTLFVRIPMPGGIPDISYDRVLVLLIVSLILIDALLSKGQLEKATLLDILVILYVAAQIGTRLHVMWFGGMGNADLNGFLDIILIPLMLYWAAKNLATSDERLQWLLYGLVIAALVILPTGLIEQALGVRIFRASLSMGGSEVNYQWQDAQGRLRAAGALANPAIYGAVLGMGSLAGICCLPLVKRRLARAALLAGIAVLLYGVFACYTRSAWLSVLAVLFAAQFFVDGLWKKTLPIAILGALLLLLLWNMIPDNANIVERALNTKTVGQRLDLMSIGLARFLEKPMTGWGAGAMNIFGSIGEGNTSHNVYLTFLVDGGVVLLVSFLAIVGRLLTRSVRIYGATAGSSLQRNVLVAMTGNLLIFLLSGMALELRYFGYFNALFWISAGVIDRLGTRLGSEGTADG